LNRSSKMVVTFFTITAMLCAGSCAASGNDVCRTGRSLSCSVGDALAEWSVYRNDEYRFQIMYPPTFDRADVPNTLVTNGAVVTFVPAYDPSINEAGDRTNLISLSVTIGVSDSTGVPETETESDAPNDLVIRVWGRHPRFVRTYRSEGAVGSRYETVAFATRLPGKRYEITLFVHSANPGCYPAGTITIFDAAETLRLFETMVRTFSPSVEGACRLVE